METAELKGIHAIVYALFDEGELLDRASMRRQVELCHAAGAHGLAALGLATEVAKLSEVERRTVMDWVAEDNAGKLPLAFTIFGGSIAEQAAQARHAEAAGADWVILQPPMVGAYGASEYIRFFGRVAESVDIPVAIQNAPAYMGRGLSAEDIRTLVAEHPNIRLVKGEGSAVEIARLIEATEGRVPVFNGRGGLELTDNLRVGCAGLILAPELIDLTARIYERWAGGDEAGAEALYAEILPAIVFVMQSIESFICYGKRLFAARAGLSVHDRAPALRPTAEGLAAVDRFARRFGPLAGERRGAGGPA